MLTDDTDGVIAFKGFKLDQDDGGVVLFKDNTSFPLSGFSGGQMHNIYVRSRSSPPLAVQFRLHVLPALATGRVAR